MKRYRLVIIGFGNIAKSLIEIVATRQEYLEEEHELVLDIVAVVDLWGAIIAPGEGTIAYSDLQKLAEGGCKPEELPGFVSGISATEVIRTVKADVMIELTPTNPKDGQPAMSYIEEAFAASMHVVTANKGPLVVDLKRVNSMAKAAGKMLKFGTATAAALPTTNVGYYDLAGSRILSISGILNGTSNFVLTKMREEGLSYREALQIAQSMGIAEYDPSLDVEGMDTAIKLIILANALLKADLTLDDLSITGITGLSAEDIANATADGKAYKLIGEATVYQEEGGVKVSASVAPKLIDATDPLYAVNGTAKAVSFSTDLIGTLLVTGGNSSPKGAAAAVLRDLVNLAREDDTL